MLFKQSFDEAAPAGATSCVASIMKAKEEGGKNVRFANQHDGTKGQPNQYRRGQNGSGWTKGTKLQIRPGYLS